MRFLTLLLLVLLCTCVRAQKVLLFERMTDSKAERMYEGEALKFRMEGDKFWQEGRIMEMRPDIQALVINERFILLEEIESVHLGSTFGAAAGYSLMTFGTAWAGIGLIGYATDKDPTTNFSGRDATIALTSFASGYLINRFLGQKRFKTSQYKRLRIVDTSF
ncbi:hypothetical protein QWY85_06920 [Neolewinella lacunae]|uniref:Uncharacterized protein n=1 Tax=Neolewinella lacunae TaxID=1517758 RepID=A0A923PL81_9BACT|nr:hypothetical protein [Neolewinella lacunae]MBC6994761.1 hypothetical protein [Neolewinella lacunae]MDN3634383.1 hypothetical protein [Neolewinella lacunae]